MSEELKQEIATLIRPEIEQSGFELVEVKVARYGKNSRVQVFVDSATGVSVDNCARLSRLVDGLLEESGKFPNGFGLEVSSPGLERPLTSERDFARKVGRSVQIDFHEKGRRTVRGTVTSVGAGAVTVEMKKGAETIRIEEIRFAKEFIEF